MKNLREKIKLAKTRVSEAEYSANRDVLRKRKNELAELESKIDASIESIDDAADELLEQSHKLAEGFYLPTKAELAGAVDMVMEWDPVTLLRAMAYVDRPSFDLEGERKRFHEFVDLVFDELPALAQRAEDLASRSC